MNSSLHILGSLFLALLLTTCGGEAPSEPKEDQPKPAFRLMAEAALFPLAKGEISAYNSLYPDHQGNLTKADRFRSAEIWDHDSAEVLISSWPPEEWPESLRSWEEDGGQVLEIGRDGIALLTHPEADSMLILSKLSQAWTDTSGKEKPFTKLITGNEFNLQITFLSSLPAESVVRVSMLDTPSKTTFWKAMGQDVQHLALVRSSWIANLSPALRDSLKQKVNIARIAKNPEEGFFPPAQEYLHTQKYPLVNKIWIYFRDPARGAASGFSAWVRGENGQRVLSKMGFGPVEETQREVLVKP